MTVEEQIESVLAEVRPRLAMHLGDVTFVRFDGETGTAYVRLQGSCIGCPLSDLTLKHGIEAMMRDRIPDVHAVEAVDV